MSLYTSNPSVHLNTECKFIPCVTENTLRLIYKDKLVNSMGGKNHCLSYELQDTHPHCVGKLQRVHCYTGWYI